MISQQHRILLALFLVIILFVAQGCLGKTQTVELMQTPKQTISCSQALSMGQNEIAGDELALVLDQALFENNLPCWKRLMKKSLIQSRPIPMNHLAKAVHEFNANESENEFSLATYTYFLGIIRGGKSYRENDQRLMKAYVGFEIKKAKTKHDARLKRAMRVCKRLDTDLYRKFFL
ncbi:hypothetical protein [Desulfobacula phenolica]|uniref:Uncharacterized protein n=1 Tax=Desulfobacula phenolica TaxID=90732 RepID=A0A1H2JLV9_9BACT|nr:hypothetical protein [Desulfobacula phenolica]SDU57098.1 hypothetical protein SAMN04487931_11365 [Desulfobacula phenolica]